MQRVIDRAHQIDELFMNDAHQLLLGLSDLSTFSPMACSVTLAMKSCTT